MITIRAKSNLKIDTGKSSLDYTYERGTPILDVTNDMLHALVQNVGTEKARELVNIKLGKYKSEYKGLATL